jgi:hypothetical protein
MFGENKFEMPRSAQVNSEHSAEKGKEGYILDLIDRYMKFLDLWEELNEKGQQELTEEILGLKFTETKKFIDEKLVLLAEDINQIIQQENLEVGKDNSFVDAVNNSTLVWISGSQKIMHGIEDGSIKNAADVKPLWLQYAEGLQKSFTIIPLYLEELCRDKEKLKMELSDKYGYLRKFEKFFFSIEALSGSHKLPYFIFFAKLESRQITQENIEQELAGLDEMVINKELIMASADTFFRR